MEKPVLFLKPLILMSVLVAMTSSSKVHLATFYQEDREQFCNDIDDDNDNKTDEGWDMIYDFILDEDKDGHGDSNKKRKFCANFRPPGAVYPSEGGDCNDNPNDPMAKFIHPRRGEVCNDIDDNCVGGKDEGLTNCIHACCYEGKVRCGGDKVKERCETSGNQLGRYLGKGPCNEGASCKSMASRTVLQMDIFYLEQNHVVVLNWVYEETDNNPGFYVERSRDGNEFKTIGYIQSGQVNIINYQFEDINPDLVSYYRLRFYLHDSIWQTQAIAATAVTDGKMVVLQSQINGKVKILLKDMQAAETEVRVYDLSGTQLISTQFYNGEHEIDASNYKSGIYIVKVLHKGRLYVEKFVKN